MGLVIEDVRHEYKGRFRLALKLIWALLRRKPVVIMTAETHEALFEGLPKPGITLSVKEDTEDLLN